MTEEEVAIDFNRICRLCLVNESKMNQIYNNQEDDAPVALQIMACLSIKITSTDALPSLICNSCLIQVDHWCSFKNMCENADLVLRKLLSNDRVNNEDILKIHQASKDLKNRLSSLEFTSNDSNERAINKADNLTIEGEDNQTKKCFSELSPLDPDPSESCGKTDTGGELIWKETESSGNIEKHSIGTQYDENDMKNLKCAPLQVLTLQYNTDTELDATAAGYSSDDSLTLLAYKEKLDKKQVKKKCVKKKVNEENQISMENEAENEASKQSVRKRFRVRQAIPSACQLCDKVYKNAEILRQHVKSHHVTGTIECQHCQTKFTSVRSLKYHEQRNHGNLEPVPCSFCGKKFLDKKYLRIHENIHSQTNQYVCQFCGRKFIMKTNLTVHINRHHTQKTNDFICQVCGKAFPFKLYLKKHFKTHTDYKPHSCSHCDARFRESTLLRKHINSIHLKLRPFVCQYCQKTFTRSPYLREHMETQHLGIPKKIECLHCGELFQNRARYRQHDCESRPEEKQ